MREQRSHLTDERRLRHFALPILLVASGCAGWKQRLETAPVTPQRAQRETEAIRNFEEQRDSAQLTAALDRWKQNDAARAETMLVGLVARRPDNLEAQLLLGEVQWSRGDASSAEPHLRAVLSAQPNRPDAHHALGLLLDGTGRLSEAQLHFARAAELEPDNVVYRETCQTQAVR